MRGRDEGGEGERGRRPRDGRDEREGRGGRGREREVRDGCNAMRELPTVAYECIVYICFL